MADGAGVLLLCLDGSLVPTDRVATRAEAGRDLWYSDEQHRQGGTVQVLADPVASRCGSRRCGPARSTT